MADVPPIFRARWLPMMRQEAARFRADLPELMDRITAEDDVASLWAGRQMAEALSAVQTILPEDDFAAERIMVQDYVTRRLAA